MLSDQGDARPGLMQELQLSAQMAGYIRCSRHDAGRNVIGPWRGLSACPSASPVRVQQYPSGRDEGIKGASAMALPLAFAAWPVRLILALAVCLTSWVADEALEPPPWPEAYYRRVSPPAPSRKVHPFPWTTAAHLEAGQEQELINVLGIPIPQVHTR